ncbi:hypothetical protein C8J57DRAFT_1215868 [Mycena rebaudengoi]|nr:hypothetical protein C8J57DRAFT_1215868 [Mycena rebaudengoi]
MHSPLFLSLFLLVTGSFGLPTSLRCTTEAHGCATGAIDRPSLSTLISRSASSGTMHVPFIILASAVGVLALLGVLAIILWYHHKRGTTGWLQRKEGFEEVRDDHLSNAKYISPPAQVYADGRAPVVAPAATSSPSSKDVPSLVVSSPNDEPAQSEKRKVKRVPVPRLSRLPSARAPLARIKSVLTPRRQEFRASAEHNVPPLPTQAHAQAPSTVSSGVASAVPPSKAN